MWCYLRGLGAKGMLLSESRGGFRRLGRLLGPWESSPVLSLSVNGSFSDESVSDSFSSSLSASRSLKYAIGSSQLYPLTPSSAQSKARCQLYIGWNLLSFALRVEKSSSRMIGITRPFDGFKEFLSGKRCNSVFSCQACSFLRHNKGVDYSK